MSGSSSATNLSYMQVSHKQNYSSINARTSVYVIVGIAFQNIPLHSYKKGLVSNVYKHIATNPFNIKLLWLAVYFPNDAHFSVTTTAKDSV